MHGNEQQQFMQRLGAAAMTQMEEARKRPLA